MARAAEKAYRTVRERILRGEYPSALRITEQEIADATGVSRTPVREALRRLQAEGFVTVIANQGAIVTEWSANDTDDVFELRALLEPYGAARAAHRITAEGIAGAAPSSRRRSTMNPSVARMVSLSASVISTVNFIGSFKAFPATRDCQP